MKKKTKRNLIIAAIVIVLLGAGIAWFVICFVIPYWYLYWEFLV